MSDEERNEKGREFPPSGEWDTDEALESLKMERDVNGELTNEQMTRKILEDAAPLAATKIVHIALHSQNDNTSLAAAKYITDYMLQDQTADGKATWEQLLGEVVSEAEVYANSTSSRED